MILSLIENFGLIGIFFMVFAESGLFFGFFFPGDSLLFSAGLLASAGHLNISYLFFGSFVFAVLGDSVGYWTGKRLGPKIFSKPDSFFFSKNNLEKAERFYETYGRKTLILARFVAVVRTFAPILAGVGNMKYNNFIFYNILGGFFWTFSMIFAGYFLGSSIKNIDQYVLPITATIIILSFVPVLIHFFQRKNE